MFSKKAAGRSLRAVNQMNVVIPKFEANRNASRYRKPIIWNFFNQIADVTDRFSRCFKILFENNHRDVDLHGGFSIDPSCLTKLPMNCLQWLKCINVTKIVVLFSSVTYV